MTIIPPILKRNGIICDICTQTREEYACGHPRRIVKALKMCSKHSHLDPYFLDYQILMVTGEESCESCRASEEAERIERGRREEVARMVREMERIRNLSEEEFRRELKEVEKRIMDN